MECKGEVFPHLLYVISAEVHFNIIHYFVHVHVMRTHHVFSRGQEDAKGKETELTNKGGCCVCLTILRNSAGVNRFKDL